MRGVRLPPAEAFHQVSRKKEGLNDLPRIMEAVMESYEVRNTTTYFIIYLIFQM